MKLNISIELNGSERHVGSIIGTGAYDARFCYSTDYIHDSDSIPVSVCPCRPSLSPQNKR